MKLCRRHKATLIIAKLDRLARNVHFISGLMKPPGYLRPKRRGLLVQDEKEEHRSAPLVSPFKLNLLTARYLFCLRPERRQGASAPAPGVRSGARCPDPMV